MSSMKRTRPAPLDEVLAAIVRDKLGFATLETREQRLARLQDVAFWSVKDALEAAYRAGLAAAKEEQR